jgi:hypothetical protein
MVSDEVPGAADGRPTGPGGMVAPGSQVAGYRLQEQIGQGGMAVVFRAQDERLGRLAALKVLAPALAQDESFRQRFVRESRAAAAVDHPHIIPIYEAGEAGGALYIAMRYVRGGDVGSLVRRLGRLSPGQTAAIISPVASALDAAHAAGLVHRDVKPGNMLLDTQPGRPDHVYLSDFGLSKAWQGSTGLTGTGLFLGTLDYAAPEQIEGRPLDGRTDQYALGCAAFELLAGEPPFRRDQALAVMYAQVSAPVPLLTERRADLPPGVNEVIARALAKSAAQRYGSCGEMAQDLRRVLGLPMYGDTGPGAAPPAREATMLASPGRTDPPAPPGGLLSADTWGHGGQAGHAAAAATVDRARPSAGRSRTRVLVTALAAAVLVAGGVTAAVALSSAPKPQPPPVRPPAQGALAPGTPTSAATTRISPSASAPTSSAPTQSPSASPSASQATTPASTPLTLIKVCTFPADGCTSATPSQMKSEPVQIVTTGDGSGYLKNLTWSAWGQPTAQGSGELEVDNCNPNCAQGTFTGYPATVALSSLTSYGGGNQAYADMTVNAPGSPQPTESFTTSLVP